MQCAMHAASVKMILGAVITTWSPQTGWMKEEVLELGYSFQADKFQELPTIRGIFILSFFLTATLVTIFAGKFVKHVINKAFACILLPWKLSPFWYTASINFHCSPKWPPWQLPSCCYAVTSYANALLGMALCQIWVCLK